MGGPETKGIMLTAVVEDVLRLEREGRISRPELLEEIGAEARTAIEDGISLISWYAPEVYRDLVRVLMRLEGNGPNDMEYLRLRGERAGPSLVERGLYEQLEFMKRSVTERKQRGASREEFERSLRIILSLAESLMRGAGLRIEPDPEHPDRLQIAIECPEGLPEETAQAVCGLLTGVTLQGGGSIRWRYERPRPERAAYRMDRDVSAL
jgi:hypothetical protein